MLRRRSNKTRLLAAAVAGLTLAPPAAASWIDSDANCQTYGCVIVFDGIDYEVYDVFDDATGNEVPVGRELIKRTTGALPPGGNGAISPLITGSLTPASSLSPNSAQGVRLGFDTIGDGNLDIEIGDSNNSGFLDAGDSLSSFQLSDVTQLVGDATTFERSFYVTSSIDFELRAEAVPTGFFGGDTLDLRASNIAFSYRLQPAGNDEGLNFGRRAQKGNNLRVLTGITSLADILNQPTPLIDFRKAVAKKNADTIAEQSVRFDYAYGIAAYDMSQGRGETDFEIAFTFHRR